MIIHRLEIDDIYLALAMEEALFKNLPAGEKALVLWCNRPAVVMGRFQNPWVECNLGKMKSANVLLARRQSGGGTVFHDEGNVNISFLDWNESYDKTFNNRVLVEALRELGHKAHTSGRSDVQIETREGPRKVSGAAFKQKRDRSFHHCTMLLASDLDALNAHLHSKLERDEVETKAISSVRSKVANINHSKATFFEALQKAWQQEAAQKAHVRSWNNDDCLEYVAQEAPEYLKKLMSWKWVFGETPLFRVSHNAKGWKVDLAVKKGLIKSFEPNHESAHPSFLSSLSEALTGAKFEIDEIKKVVFGVSGAEIYQEELNELILGLDESFGIGFRLGGQR